MKRIFQRWVLPLFVMSVLSFTVILFTEQSDRSWQNRRQVQTEEQNESEQTFVTVSADDQKQEEIDSSRVEWETRATNAIERNFGRFYDYVDSDRDYETYFIERYRKYRIDDLSKWKDKKGQWCYPEEYEFAWVPADVAYMAAQQFPPELLEDMDTEELLAFILKGEKTTLTWGWNTVDHYLMWMAMHYRLYNYMHELMNREDCAKVVHQYYKRYSKSDKKKYSKMKKYWAERGGTEESLEAVNFQFIEGLEWFFMALEGKEVPDEYAYGSELEKSLNNPSRLKEYTFQEDVTHDGVADTITLHMAALYDESLATGEEETVTVTSGKTGKKIASYTANTIHSGWNGIYLYEDYLGSYKYLLQWQPAMYQGVGAFRLRIFSLQEDGTEDVLVEKEYHFDLNPDRLDFDEKKYQDFMDLVNVYLKHSYVIVDTDQGEAMYATQEKSLIAPYDGSWVIDEYKELNGK